MIYPFLASDDFCRLLITFANSLDPEQDRQNVGPDLGPNRLVLLYCSLKCIEKVYFEKKSAENNKSMKNTQHAKWLLNNAS